MKCWNCSKEDMTPQKDKANHSYFQCSCGATTTPLDLSRIKVDRTQPIGPDIIAEECNQKAKKAYQHGKKKPKVKEVKK